MLPYFRSMEAFFDLSLPKSWADLSDPQLLFFFRQLATDKTMAEIQALCLCQWATSSFVAVCTAAYTSSNTASSKPR